MSRQQRQPEHDEGSALIMAIVFVTVIGLAMAAGLGYAAATLRAQTNAYTPARDKLYAADAAMKAAVQYILNNPSEGNAATNPTCAPVRDYATVRGDKVTTQVCPQGVSLTPKGGGQAWALMTLATGSRDGEEEDHGDQKGEAGLDISGTLQVNGNVYANSDIVGDNLVVNGGTVKALHGCSGLNITVDGVKFTKCLVKTAPASDPGYVTGLIGAPAAGTGSCDSTTKIASLQPGTWTSQKQIDDIVDKCTLVNFLPGVHYFESFDWTIKQRAIAGKLVTGFTSATPWGSACVRGGATGDGAMLVFGGTSTVRLSGSDPSLEVCGLSVNQPSLSKSVMIPIFGPTADIVTTYADTFSVGDSPTGTGWTKPDQAKTVDTKTATYSVAKNAKTKDLVFANITGANPLPPILVPTLTVDVTAASPTANDTVAVTVVDSKDNTLCTTPTAGKLKTTLSKVTLSLTCTKSLTSGWKANLAITALNSGSTRTVSVDGISISYSGVSTPTIKAQSGCVVDTSSGCDFIASSGSKNTFWFDGQVYLPGAKINVQLPNSSAGFTTQAMVVRVLKVKSTGSTSLFPIVASDNGGINSGDVTVIAKVGATSWMTCRVSLATSGSTVTGATIQGCTLPY